MTNPDYQSLERIIDISERSKREISEFLDEGMEKDTHGTRVLLKILRSRMDMCRFDAMNTLRDLSLRDLQAEANEANAQNEAFRTTDGE